MLRKPVEDRERFLGVQERREVKPGCRIERRLGLRPEKPGQSARDLRADASTDEFREERGSVEGGIEFARSPVAPGNPIARWQCRDEVVGVNDPFYIVSRWFTRDENGPRTQLKLVPLNSIVMGE